VLDLDLVVDRQREAVDLSVDELRAAVHERDRAATHLAQLIDWRDTLQSIRATCGSECVQAQPLEANA
jgi:hypothetical protein